MKLLFDESGKNLPNKKIDAKQQYALVVEDDPDTNQLINIVLTTGGFEVYPAWNGRARIPARLREMRYIQANNPPFIIGFRVIPRVQTMMICSVAGEKAW